jgi:hypothetical protein
VDLRPRRARSDLFQHTCSKGHPSIDPEPAAPPLATPPIQPPIDADRGRSFFREIGCTLRLEARRGGCPRGQKR